MGRPAPGFFQLLSWAREYRAGGPGPKATLLALMERMGEHEPGVWSAHPSQKSLAFDSEQGVRTVQRHLAKFVEAGVIAARPRLGWPGKSNLYVLEPAILARSTRHSDAPDGALNTPSGASSPYIEHQGTTSRNNVASLPRSETVRGTRLPDPFSLSEPLLGWASTNVPGFDVVAATDAFCDYWRSQPGARGKKADWEATWRNWMRRAAGETARRRQRRDEPAGFEPLREWMESEGMAV